jgi:hypothetical protein
MVDYTVMHAGRASSKLISTFAGAPGWQAEPGACALCMPRTFPAMSRAPGR